MTFSSNHEHEGINLTLVGQWQDLAAYYRGDNGSAWIYNHCTRGWTNAGTYAEFIERFSNGKYRGKLTQ